MKDLFSQHSQLYQQARPTYPPELVQELLKFIPERHFAWDCGAGSGQLTQLLAPYFDQIVATDISANQLQHAAYFDNVSYQVQPAEKTTFPDQCFDLITVAQAIHWFDFEAFYAEVRRTLKPAGILAVIGYGLMSVDDQAINMAIRHLYQVTLKDYWDAERRYIDEAYQTIPFPFKELSLPVFKIEANWRLEQLMDYLQTWSAVRHYRKKNGTDPLLEIAAFQRVSTLKVEFPVLARVGQ